MRTSFVDQQARRTPFSYHLRELCRAPPPSINAVDTAWPPRPTCTLGEDPCTFPVFMR